MPHHHHHCPFCGYLCDCDLPDGNCEHECAIEEPPTNPQTPAPSPQ